MISSIEANNPVMFMNNPATQAFHGYDRVSSKQYDQNLVEYL